MVGALVRGLVFAVVAVTLFRSAFGWFAAGVVIVMTGVQLVMIKRRMEPLEHTHPTQWRALTTSSPWWAQLLRMMGLISMFGGVVTIADNRGTGVSLFLGGLLAWSLPVVLDRNIHAAIRAQYRESLASAGEDRRPRGGSGSMRS